MARKRNNNRNTNTQQMPDGITNPNSQGNNKVYLTSQLPQRKRRSARNIYQPKPNITPADPRYCCPEDQFGDTKQGAYAVRRMLNPNGEDNLDGTKIPDGACGTSISYPRRDEFDLRAPAQTTPAYDSWNTLVIHLPFVTFRDLVLRWPSTLTPTDEDLQNSVKQLLESTAFERVRYPEYDTIASATTPTSEAFPIATDFANGATYTFLVPTQQPFVSGNVTQTPNVTIRSLRRCALGYTTQLDASSLYNEGRVISGQWTPNVSLGTLQQTATYNINPEGSTTPVATKVVIDQTDVYEFEVPPLNSDDIVASDNYRRQDLAKTGSYMPIRPADSTFPMTPAAEIRPIHAITDSQFLNIDNDYDAITGAGDLWMRGWCVGVELWLNLHPTAQLRVKVNEDLELVPSGNSPISPFMQEGCPLDNRALAILREFSRTSPHAFPEYYNTANRMWGSLISGLGNVLSSLGLPVISSIAKPAASWINSKIYPANTAQKAGYKADESLD